MGASMLLEATRDSYETMDDLALLQQANLYVKATKHTHVGAYYAALAVRIAKGFAAGREFQSSSPELEVIVQRAFEIYDVDGSGYIDREEIKNVINDACEEIGQPAVTDEQLDSVMAATDANGDRKFSFDEFYMIIAPLIERQMTR